MTAPLLRLRPRMSGFTLVELLTALVILTIMLLALTTTIGFVSRAWQEGISFLDNYSKARVMLNLLDRDIQLMIIRRDTAAFADGSGTPACAFYTSVMGSPGAASARVDGRTISLVQYQLATTTTSSVLQRLNYGMNFAAGGVSPAVANLPVPTKLTQLTTLGQLQSEESFRRRHSLSMAISRWHRNTADALLLHLFLQLRQAGPGDEPALGHHLAVGAQQPRVCDCHAKRHDHSRVAGTLPRQRIARKHDLQRLLEQHPRQRLFRCRAASGRTRRTAGLPAANPAPGGDSLFLICAAFVPRSIPVPAPAMAWRWSSFSPASCCWRSSSSRTSRSPDSTAPPRPATAGRSRRKRSRLGGLQEVLADLHSEISAGSTGGGITQLRSSGLHSRQPGDGTTRTPGLHVQFVDERL